MVVPDPLGTPASVPVDPVVPEDEPIMFFRARDIQAIAALGYYRVRCEAARCKQSHLAGIQNRIDAFLQFAKEHPERMKEPGVTEHIKL